MLHRRIVGGGLADCAERVARSDEDRAIDACGHVQGAQVVAALTDAQRYQARAGKHAIVGIAIGAERGVVDDHCRIEFHQRSWQPAPARKRSGSGSVTALLSR